MKATLITTALLVTTFTLCGQNPTKPDLYSGKITYEEKDKLEIKLEGEAAALAADFPKERISQKSLLFKNEASLFEEVKSIDDEMSAQQQEGVRIKMVVSGQNKIFTDLKNQKTIEQRDFMNRVFLIEKAFPELNWKITGNQKVILGYPCMEATRSDTAGVKTVVWFAPTIPVRSGPAGFCNLPGMVLEADINNGSRHITAKTIEAVPAGDLKIQKPKEGKTVTEGEFKDIVAAKMKEMGIETGGPGGGTQMHIIIKKQ